MATSQINPIVKVTISDLINFFFKAKWFALVGIFIGAVAAFSYIYMNPIVYHNKITIQIQPETPYNTVLKNLTISSEQLTELFKFSTTASFITNKMQISPQDKSYSMILESLKSSVISNKGGIFLTLSTNSTSPIDAKEIGLNLADATIFFISQLNISKVDYMKKLLAINNELIAVAYKYPAVDISNLRNTNLAIESYLSSPTQLKPTLVDNIIKPIPRKPVFTILTLLGLGIGLLLFYLREILSKKK